ncbi:MAG TPA: ribokinase [Woeseiaceae bacterium]|jgi:ribokinase|nr:ribokinase [Woeseiaceae bacterium]
MTASVVIVGSVNLDLTATVHRLPSPGETVTGATLQRFPGGKGANQALAAKRLGADVALVALVGDDAAAEEALAILRREEVDLTRCGTHPSAATGVALIAVAPSGENHIVVAPGANAELRPERLDLPQADALICQLEVPVETLCCGAETFRGFFCVNLAPAREVPRTILDRADLIVVNEGEAAYYGEELAATDALVAVTRGKAGATLSRRGRRMAQSSPPPVTAIDTTGAGDAFTAALTLGLVEDMSPPAALRFACTAGALATTTPGAQPSLPHRHELESLLSPL